MLSHHSFLSLYIDVTTEEKAQVLSFTYYEVITKPRTRKHTQSRQHVNFLKLDFSKANIIAEHKKDHLKLQRISLVGIS